MPPRTKECAKVVTNHTHIANCVFCIALSSANNRIFIVSLLLLLCPVVQDILSVRGRTQWPRQGDARPGQELLSTRRTNGWPRSKQEAAKGMS